MAYKTSFRPLERLGRDGWRRLDEMEEAQADAGASCHSDSPQPQPLTD